MEATAQGPNQAPGPMPLVFPPLPAGLDAESVTELGLLDGIGKVVNEAGGQSIKDAMTMNAASKSKRTRSVKAVGYLVKRNVAAGKLKLHLRLGRAALAKLAGKRSRVTLVVRIDMVMPSAVLHAGVPRVLVKRITLKRAPVGHHKKH